MSTSNHELHWNVIDETEFKERVSVVFSRVANTLRNTLGPYGSNTILEKFGQMHVTKDGWQILKKIRFDDATDNNILQLLVNISAQVVIKVGDGSTSSIVAANAVLEEIEKSTKLKGLRSKDLLDIVAEVVDTIADGIQKQAKMIESNEESTFEEIHKLAMVSTNGDKNIADIVRTIYTETGNPFIEYKTSKTNRTHYDIIEGYQIPITYLDRIYSTNDDGTCEVKKPVILMFDHKIERDFYVEHIIYPALNKAMEEHTRVIVIAPHYDSHLLDYIRTQANAEYRGSGTTSIVYARVSLVNNMHHEYYNDFSILTGGQIIRESDIPDFIKKENPNNVEDFLGTVNSIIIGADSSFINGFTNKNESMYKLAMNDALAKYKEVEAKHSELNIVDSELYELKKRISKLRSTMGVIHVGGNSSLEKVSNYDLVEDAVKACESAYNYGYNIGGNIIIPFITDMLKEETTDEIKLEVLNVIGEAFKNVFIEVLGNKFVDASPEELKGIANKAVKLKAVYDLIKDEYSTEVINPCRTDIEILRAATSMVSLLMSSNQYVSIKTQGEE